MPQRIQRKRTKGWRMPDGAVNVCRPGPWGNPWREGDRAWTVGPGGVIDRNPHGPLTREEAIESYRNSYTHGGWDELVRRQLGGKDLVCWCPLDQPCHADVLLEIANSPATLAERNTP
mgnify:CR=1 FL=1